MGVPAFVGYDRLRLHVEVMSSLVTKPWSKDGRSGTMRFQAVAVHRASGYPDKTEIMVPDEYASGYPIGHYWCDFDRSMVLDRTGKLKIWDWYLVPFSQDEQSQFSKARA